MKNYAHEVRGPILTNIYNLSERPPKYFKRESADVNFREADARHMHHPHNDALVVNALIGGTNVYQMLVDNGSSVNILAYSTYQKIGLVDNELLPFYNDVYGFTGPPVLVVGRIKLPVTLGEEPWTATRITEFVVVNEDISYNGIIGRPLLREMRIITFIHHFSIKFPTPNGIGWVKGCHVDSRECYNRALHMAM
ncbi:uncharacterized protein LOC141686183 [Apium graveolens]|uniref:uncharacterized protein LOC141686183 n=1 Tax=Apium graveolens TaxID=4045 RepID=UPI003D7A8C18